MTLIKSISGIRGTIGGKPGESLSPPDIVKYTSAFAQLILQNKLDPSEVNPQLGRQKVVIGRDARISGEMVCNLVCGTLQSMGLDVLDLGLSTTPTVEMAVIGEKASGGIIITASHNPAEWNALKLLNFRGEFISAYSGDELLALAESGTIAYADAYHAGNVTSDHEYISKHISKILALELVDHEAIARARFKVVVDAVNSTGGTAIPQLLAALGVSQVSCINCVSDGVFTHNPEPLAENLTELCDQVLQTKAHLGIAVDPDVDRLVLVCEDGTLFGEEYTLVAVADYVLGRHKGNTVSNLSSTRALEDVTIKHGGTYQAAAVGEVNVVRRMKETSAVIGGEGNGGIILPELHYGRDALVGVALFLSHLAHVKLAMTALKRTYPAYHISKNKITIPDGSSPDKILQEIVRLYEGQRLNLEDGVRIDFPNEWVHIRKSNTEPIVRIIAESSDEHAAGLLAGRIMADFRKVFEGFNPG